MFKKRISLVLCLLMMSTLFVFSGSSVEARANSEVTPTAACKSTSISYYSKNSATKEVTFRVSGTPGNMASLYITKFLGNLYKMKTVYLSSSGVSYITVKVENGTYEANASQLSPCSGSYVGPILFTMN